MTRLKVRLRDLSKQDTPPTPFTLPKNGAHVIESV